MAKCNCEYGVCFKCRENKALSKVKAIRKETNELITKVRKILNELEDLNNG